MTPQLYIDAAREYLGTPFGHQRADHVKCDCKGLVVAAALDCGMEFRDPEAVIDARYPREADGTLERILAVEGASVELDSLRMGDVLLFQFVGVRYPHHLGILTYESGGEQWFIHASYDAGEVVEQSLSGQLRDGLVGAYRFWGFPQ
jgi:cell wall-associated NlpC family hydrolase